MPIKIKYFFAACPNCEVGGLYLEKDITHQKLFLRCCECEFGWDDPNNLSIDKSYLTLDMVCEVNQHPTVEEIVEGGWGYILQNCIAEINNNGKYSIGFPPFFDGK